MSCLVCPDVDRTEPWVCNGGIRYPVALRVRRLCKGSEAHAEFAAMGPAGLPRLRDSNLNSSSGQAVVHTAL